jgi:RND family efflux transporter MFP subunit
MTEPAFTSDTGRASTAQAGTSPPDPALEGQGGASSPTAAGAVHPAGEQGAQVPVGFAPQTGRRVLAVACVVTLALAGAYEFNARQRAQAEAGLTRQLHQSDGRPPTVSVAKVELAACDSPLALPAECRAFLETTIFARVNGYLRQWDYDIGDRVKAATVLATIDTPELDEQINIARAKLDSLIADAKLAQATVDFARITSERFQAGAPGGAVSQQEADQKKSELDVSVARLESAKAQVALGRAEVRRLETLAGFKSVVAPFDGVITHRHIDIGDLITAGSTSNTTPLFTVCRSDKVRVYVKVPQVARPGIRVGSPGVVTAREFPGRTFNGTVDRTAEAINPASGTLRVEVLADNPDGALLPGMFANVTFHCRRANPPVRVPAAALMMLPDGPHVAVVEPDQRVRFQPIEIAKDLGDEIEVSKGLSPGQTVAMNISNEIVNGEKVNPVSAGMPAQAARSAAPKPAPGTAPAVQARGQSSCDVD